jgi:hypothetical protein
MAVCNTRSDNALLHTPYNSNDESVRMPIDTLSGSSGLRETIDADRTSPADLQGLAEVDAGQWLQRSSRFRLYS